MNPLLPLTPKGDFEDLQPPDKFRKLSLVFVTCTVPTCEHASACAMGVRGAPSWQAHALEEFLGKIPPL